MRFIHLLVTGTVLLTFSGFACPDISDAVLVDIDERLCFLPIRLSDFHGTMVDPKDHCEGVKINWTTAVEENTSHYVLERSPDGIKFECGRRKYESLCLREKPGRYQV